MTHNSESTELEMIFLKTSRPAPAAPPPHLQLRAVLEAEAVLQQAGDVGQVHAQEGAAGRRLGHLVTHCGTERDKGSLRGQRSRSRGELWRTVHRLVTFFGSSLEVSHRQRLLLHPVWAGNHSLKTLAVRIIGIVSYSKGTHACVIICTFWKKVKGLIGSFCFYKKERKYWNVQIATSRKAGRTLQLLLETKGKTSEKNPSKVNYWKSPCSLYFVSFQC